MSSAKIKDLFNGRFFEIPKYQRGYAWEAQNVQDLFDDISESIESNSSHYVGTIVLSTDGDDDEKFYVVDGQQRITTLTLIISALVKKLSKDDSIYFTRSYIEDEGRYKLSPATRDKAYFVDLLNGIGVAPQNKSQRTLHERFKEIELRVETIPDKKKFLKSLEKLEIVEFIENSEGDAIRIFQTVNDRGKPLSNVEKAKSLLIYFSNRYLNRKLDDTINDYFSDIFETYDDIKILGESLGIRLINNKDFNEDNLMRYHFVTYSQENYDPSAEYVFHYLKTKLSDLRKDNIDAGYVQLEKFINSYTSSLKIFFESFRKIISMASTDKNYYNIFVVLNLSATLYPLITELATADLLDKPVSKDGKDVTFLNLVELIDVRVYKTRGTDPKADIAKIVNAIRINTPNQIAESLMWFNQRWMTKEQFQSNLHANIYENRSLNHIFITYSEELHGTEYTLKEFKEFVSKTPNIEHILSQTPNFDPQALGFQNLQDFLDHEHQLGNLTVLEKSLNSAIQNKSTFDKSVTYKRSLFKMTNKLSAEIDTSKKFTKTELINRTKEIADFCLKKWWC
ncbi:DUF262 domain-containing protein [Fulvivirgaceae bacterium PWU5]|uniref:DUF262 domain-containing protein n=1 Tax=Dawidia cretensis TaxID=2782350 RepID=A0AAP2DW15_9BACT|nr:DUF262 domain-containing protein [Dawidia cretensis]MBT1708415.1 DUF262 domain-containing protein [Dawidia cretensis]